MKVLKALKIVSFALIAAGLLSASAYARDMDVTMDVVKQSDAKDITEKVMKRIDLPGTSGDTATRAKEGLDRNHNNGQKPTNMNDRHSANDSKTHGQGGYRQENGDHVSNGKSTLDDTKGRHQAHDDASDARDAHNDAQQVHEDAHDARDDAQQIHEDAHDARDDAQQAHEDANDARNDAQQVHEDARDAHNDSQQAHEDAN